MIRPATLRPGDLVALVAPSGAVEHDRLAAASEVLTGWGLRVRLGTHALGRRTFLSGTDDERLADLNDALRDDEVRGVLCLRGGYGAQRIVDRLDLAAVRRDPKLVMGFSDITALHLALWTSAGLATVHGPTVLSLASGADQARHALMTGEPVVVAADEQSETFPVRVPGRATGTLWGGNLTLLATSAGTRHRPDPRGTILLIEDVHEEPYRVDRSLVQLRRAGWLDGLAGVAVGQFTDCADVDNHGVTVTQVLTDQLTPLQIPVLGGLPIGHGPHQTAIPLGVPAVLDTNAATLTAEPATT